MKKNTMMRIASVLMIAVLLTTCVISGTFAKYTTSSTGSDQARVAYWGFDADAAITLNLFDTTYDNNAVKSADDDNVIAPGTAKEATFNFKYTVNDNDAISAPEVDYIFTVDCDVTGSYAQLDANENFYWTLDGAKKATVAELIAAVKALAGATAVDGVLRYGAGTLPEAFTAADDAHTIGWVWDFETTNDADQDVADTALGNGDPLENISITITISATQVNE